MRRALPMQALLAIVAIHALGILHRDRRAPLLRESDQCSMIDGILDVVGAGAMARLAHLALPRSAWVLAKYLGVQGTREMLVLGIVALHAGLLTHVSGGVQRGCLRGGIACGRKAKHDCREQSQQPCNSHGLVALPRPVPRPARARYSDQRASRLRDSRVSTQFVTFRGEQAFAKTIPRRRKTTSVVNAALADSGLVTSEAGG